MKPADEGLDGNEMPAIASRITICGIASGPSQNTGVWIGDRFACAGKEGIFFGSWLRIVDG
jgi:hypothetical protein